METATFPPPLTRPVGRVRRGVYSIVNERTAIPVSLMLVLVSALGDAATGAEAAFTLAYLLPVAIVTWFCGPRRAYPIIGLAIVLSGMVDLYATSHPVRPLPLLWNTSGEAALFVLYAHTLGALRRRVDAEVDLRQAALGQLRHAERLTTIGKLASGVAHELGTPLNVVVGRAQLIAQGRLDAAATKHSAKIIVEQGDRMTATIRQLLDFARRGAAVTSREDIRALCASTASLLAPLAKERGVTIEVTGESAFAAVNFTELEQVLGNLVSNAVHAMPDGGRISISTSATSSPGEGPEDRRHANGSVIVAVRDEGTGIAPELLPHIFDPFFTTKPEGQGTGLGLSVSYGIVRDHGGAIRVSTSLGEGTTFFVVLPRSP